jgi:YegS/Rv2252/BmrU family lipid kinase
MPWRIRSNQEIIEKVRTLNTADLHTVVAAGGDGTVHGVVNAMMKCGIDTPLGIFPEGTANDVANYLKISSRVNAYCRTITEGKLKSIDLGKVNDEYFINVASAGFITQTAHEVDHHLKNVLGNMAYYLKTLEKIPKIKPLQLRLAAESQEHNMEILLFLILNGGTAGGFQGIMPEGRMDDGWLDFVAIKSLPLHRLPQLMFSFSKGQHLEDPNIFYIRAKDFSLNVEPSVTTDLDGEKGPDLPWRINVCHQAIKLRVP